MVLRKLTDFHYLACCQTSYTRQDSIFIFLSVIGLTGLDWSYISTFLPSLSGYYTCKPGKPSQNRMRIVPIG